MFHRTTSMRAAGTAFVVAALLAVPLAATAGAAQGAVTAGTPPATAKMSPPEKPGGAHQHTEWPEHGQLHQDCGPWGPWSGDQENCPDDDDGSGNDSAGSGGPQWGGPGERIAVGRDMDLEAAEDEAKAEADDVCHGDWDLRDFDWELAPNGASIYTLTYECS
jgi:hypothetical protein